MIKNLSAVSSSYVCPKCGTAKKSGVSSCCARGGSWFKNCGDTVDTQFDHTWTEGIRACRSKLIVWFCAIICHDYARHAGHLCTLTSLWVLSWSSRIPTKSPTGTSLPVLSTTKACAKCGAINKHGALSCCAPGGAWFKNCGDAGDTQFDHTWTEGIQACKGSATSDSVESPLQVVHRYTEVGVYQFDITHTRNATRQQTNIYRSDNVSNTGTGGSEDYIRFTKVIACMSVLLCQFHLQIWLYSVIGVRFPTDISRRSQKENKKIYVS